MLKLVVGILALSAVATPATSVAQVEAAVKVGTEISLIPPSLTPSLAQASGDDLLPVGMNQACSDSTGNAIAPPPVLDCIVGKSAVGPKIAILGDSHALMWSRALSEVAETAGGQLLVEAHQGCGAPDLQYFNVATGSPDRSCAGWKAAAIKDIDEFKPKIVIVTSEFYGRYDYQQAPITAREWKSGIEKVLRQLKAPGRTLVVLGDIPYLTEAGPNCLAANESNVQRCTTPVLTAVKSAGDRAEKAAALADHATYINPVPWMCTSTKCPAIIAGIEVYQNEFHITSTYGEYLSGVLGSALGV